MPADSETALRPRLGLLDATAVALGAMIGAGIFVATGEAAAVTGGSLLLAILLGAAVATCNGLSAAELGVAYPRAGGAYEFGYRTLSPVVGFTAGWIFLLAAIAASTTYALAFASYLEPLFPGLPPRAVGVALAAAAVAVNALGVRPSGRANRTLLAFTVLVLLTFVILGLPRFDPARLPPLFVGGPVGLLQAAALMFFAFTGYARPVTLVEEVKRPESTLPRAVVLALSTATALYLVVALAALGLVGPERLGAGPAPLRMALEGAAGIGAWGPLLMSLGALVATTNVLLTELWGLSRLAFAMARRNDLPSPLAHLSEPGGIPRRAVLALGAVVILLTAVADLRSALAASSLALLVYYAVTNLAALRLRPEQLLYPRLISAAGLASCIALALSLPPASILIVATAAVVGLVYFYLVRRQKS